MRQRTLLFCAKMGEYDHLDKEPHSQFSVHLPMQEVADRVVSLNYGTVRFLAALVRARRRELGEDDRMAQQLENMLNEGWW